MARTRHGEYGGPRSPYGSFEGKAQPAEPADHVVIRFVAEALTKPLLLNEAMSKPGLVGEGMVN